ncbi:efflux RND transporter periplasmic adaptor subunit [Mucilaginibacter terrenus]|nr:efflux RND transporter periplasmic adaptor subunit [Mucilaginibacter terrenus]
MNKIKIWITVFMLAMSACKPKPQVMAAKTTAKAYYTCSMHPQVHEDHDGNCPICAMKLIKVELTGTMGDMATDKIILTATQIQLAAIQTDTVKEQNTGNEKTLNGTVTTDETGAQELSARSAGRVQQLFVRAISEKIAIGQPVYSIYSENLQEAEKEYLLAKQQQKLLHNPDVDYKQLINAAESKLQLWGLSASQINSLAASGKVSASTVILSKVSGTVSDIAVHEGDYVTEGMTVLKTQSLNNLWVEAQLYANEANNYKVNDRVNVSFPDLGRQVIAGKVEFINPELSDASKVDLVRISISNMQGAIRPGMLAYLTIGSTANKSLAVPASAVLTDGKGSRVWVKNTDGSFSPRMIKPGNGNQNYVAILSGLNKGDIVVTNGAYLLNSEAIFKNGTGDNMAGMKM